VYNYWKDIDNRIIDADKQTISLTCLNSLLKSIAVSGHEVVFSIHDDTSPDNVIESMGMLCQQYDISGELINSGALGNFKSQYEWLKKQDCDYVYCVEDDYLHETSAINDIVNMIAYLKEFNPGDYAVFPFNCPHRYASFEMLYPSYVVKGPTQYWRSSFHSTHTFFMSKESFTRYDNIMQEQAYTWATNAAIEDTTINKVWQEQKTMLFTPLKSLAYHLSDPTQEDKLGNWQQLWDQNKI
jgi:hypothetical protein